MPRVCHHAGAKIAAHETEDAEERAKCGYEQHTTQSFIAVSEAEDESGAEYANPETMTDACELLLQVAAENEFFADAGADAERSVAASWRRQGKKEA